MKEKSIQQFNNIRLIRTQARKLPLQALEEFLDKFTVVVVERRYEEANRLTAERQRLERMIKIRAMMLQEGIDPADLLTMATQPKRQQKTLAVCPLKKEFEYENNGTST